MWPMTSNLAHNRGTAEPGEKMIVTMGKYAAETVADKERHWMVAIGPMEAGGPFEMTIAGKNTVTIRGLILEVVGS